ncbi:MAG TPA: alpha/beta fold hydrolase [Caldimonas sp.]|nr:alpha/beta fold hydrolase [Caldimonas sp.]HEX4234090.1 alpha/beta fold hydrolase [Caldimonas sp.]
MTAPPSVAFLCAHLADERLFAAQRAAIAPREACVFVFRDEDTLPAMAERVLAAMPPRFAVVGLSLGGYVAFEIVRRALDRIDRLVLLDTTAAADTPARRAGRLADIAKVEAGGIDALIPELPGRWLLPAHAARADLVALLRAMASSVGANGQRNQQRAMLGRPDSHDDLARVRVPTLVVCGEEDPVTPVADHAAIAACIPGARFERIADCGHLSTIEQPEAVSRILVDWLAATR